MIELDRHDVGVTGHRPIGPVGALRVVVHRILAPHLGKMRPPAIGSVEGRIGDVGENGHKQMAGPGGRQVKPFRRSITGFGALTAPEGGRKPSPPPISAAFNIMAPDDTRPSPSSHASSATHANGGDGASPVRAASAAMVVGALGVVFGDIGTSPLYTLRESFVHGSGMTPTPRHVLGVLSILFWAVTLTVTIKYVTLIMRADNKGEGGVLALATLATQGLNGRGRNIRRAISLFAVTGLASFYGDATIPPAIAVRS